MVIALVAGLVAAVFAQPAGAQAGAEPDSSLGAAATLSPYKTVSIPTGEPVTDSEEHIDVERGYGQQRGVHEQPVTDVRPSVRPAKQGGHHRDGRHEEQGVTRGLARDLLREEGREVKSYLDLHRSTPTSTAAHDAALLLARESADHAATLAGLSGGSAEPWHRTGSVDA